MPIAIRDELDAARTDHPASAIDAAADQVAEKAKRDARRAVLGFRADLDCHQLDVATAAAFAGKHEDAASTFFRLFADIIPCRGHVPGDQPWRSGYHRAMALAHVLHPEIFCGMPIARISQELRLPVRRFIELRTAASNAIGSLTPNEGAREKIAGPSEAIPPVEVPKEA